MRSLACKSTPGTSTTLPDRLPSEWEAEFQRNEQKHSVMPHENGDVSWTLPTKAEGDKLDYYVSMQMAFAPKAEKKAAEMQDAKTKTVTQASETETETQQ